MASAVRQQTKHTVSDRLSHRQGTERLRAHVLLRRTDSSGRTVYTSKDDRLHGNHFTTRPRRDKHDTARSFRERERERAVGVRSGVRGRSASSVRGYWRGAQGKLYASAANNRRRQALWFRVVRPLSVNSYFAWPGISVPSGAISTKLGRNIHHVSGHC